MNSLRERKKKEIIAAKRNIIPLMSVEDVIHTRGKIVKSSRDMITIKLNKQLLKKLEDIYAMSEGEHSEYVGVIRVSYSGSGYVKFNTPTKHTNKNPVSVIPPINIRNEMIMYHSHPVPDDPTLNKSLVTLPSTGDFVYYIENYPTLQVNVILERHGYYLIDVLDTSIGNKPDPVMVRDVFYRLLQNKGMDQYMIPYRVGNMDLALIRVSIQSWQAVMNNYIDVVMRHRFGVSIKYYTYNQQPEITLVNPLSLPVPMSLD